MALSILDGNQSATTLSTILSSGQHITAHTVISLGTQAITDIVNATSAGLTNTQLRASAVTIVGSVFVSQPPVSTARLGVNLVDSSGTGNYGTDGSPFKISGTKASDEDTTQLPTLPVQLVDFSEQIIGVPSNPLPISGTVTVGSALPAGTNRIGVVTIGAGTVTLGASTAQIGSVTASISNSLTISSLPAISGTVTVANSLTVSDITNAVVFGISDYAFGASFPISGAVTIGSALPSGTNRIGVVTIGAGTVTLGASTAQIGSVTASISNSVTIASLPAISGTVTANTFALQGTAVTTSNFTSTTASTVLADFNATREVLTIFNEGAGNLHICAGATCTTIAYQVRLSAGDYYEVPNHQTTITHSAVFATAGTARIVQIS